jgi:hypothetical protein
MPFECQNAWKGFQGSFEVAVRGKRERKKITPDDEHGFPN